MTHPLLIPRYKCQIDYPQSRRRPEDEDNCYIFIKGDVLVQQSVTTHLNGNTHLMWRRTGRCGWMSVGVPMIKNPEDYPEIFRLMPWFEERTPEQMPEYIKLEIWNKPQEYTVHKIGLEYRHDWALGDYYGVIEIHGRGGIICTGFEPATLKEYETYLSTNKPSK